MIIICARGNFGGVFSIRCICLVIKYGSRKKACPYTLQPLKGTGSAWDNCKQRNTPFSGAFAITYSVLKISRFISRVRFWNTNIF